MVKVKAKNISRFSRLKKTCCLGVSLHSVNHTGEKLEAAVDYINENFDKCLIDLSDTLYAHHYMSAGISRAEAYGLAKQEGDRWLSNNQKIIEKLEIPYQIIRWDYWLNHSDFVSLREQYKNLFDNNENFRLAVLRDVCNYYQRKYKKDVSHVDPKYLKSSINYLIEEIACHTLLIREYECVNVYPGKQLECYRVIQENLIENAPYGIQNFWHIRLNVYETDALRQHAA